MKRTFSFLLATGVLLLLTSLLLPAQDKEKGVVKLSLTYTRVNDQLPVLKVSAKTKTGKRFEPVEGVEVHVSFAEETPKGLVGRVTTDNKGNASVTMPATFATQLDSSATYTFYASITGTDRFEEASTEIEINRARIELSLTDSNSERKVDAKVVTLQDGAWKEAPETEVKVFVKRLFSDLPVGEGIFTTNETGDISTDFAITLPGDPTGTIIVGAKIDDSDVYGNIAATKPVRWGVPLQADNSFSKRTLFSTRDKTPYWLLIFPNLIIITVWGFIFYLFYLIRRIRKVGLQ